MPKTLLKLEQIDKNIALEHKAWLAQYLNANRLNNFISLEEIEDLDFGLANYPHLWPSKRIGKTHLAEKKKQSPVDLIQQKISRQQFKRRFLSIFNPKILNVDQFDKDYQKYLKLLKEKFLISALEHTIQLAMEGGKSNPNLTNKLNELKNLSSLYLHTREDCLLNHYEVSKAIQTVSKNIQAEIESCKNQLASLTEDAADFRLIVENELKKYQDMLRYTKQCEILAKRYIDIYYDKDKKQSYSDYIKQNVSNTTLSLGLWTGIFAFGLTIGGFFMPPLWIPAGILGYISFISFTRSLVTSYKMIEEGTYKRSPSMTDLRDVLMDALLLPLYSFGAQIITGLGKAVSAIHGFSTQMVHKTHQAFGLIAIIWDGMISNLDDVPDSKTAFFGVKKMFSGYDPIKNTKTATSWAYLKRNLSMDQPIEFADYTIKENKLLAQEIAKETLQDIKARGSQGSAYQFTYMLFTKTDQSEMKHFKSYHQAILSFKTKEPELLHVLKRYQSLKPDERLAIRKAELELLKNVCQMHHIDKLKQFIELELNSIKNLIDQKANEPPLLVQYHLK